MNLIKNCADILLCRIGSDFVVYQGDHEYFISHNKDNAEKQFNNLIAFSEYENNA